MKTISPGQALWIIGNLPKTPPNGVMPSAWLKSKKETIVALQDIIDEPATPAPAPSSAESETR